MQEQISPDLFLQLADLEKQALDEFSRLTIAGARSALVDIENPLRLNFFSAAMRILFEHMMGHSHDHLSSMRERLAEFAKSLFRN
jgi:hypothetical protein